MKALKIRELAQKHPMMTSAEIGERLDCHPAYVRAALHRAGIFRGKHKPGVLYERASKYVRLTIEEYRRLRAKAGEA